jgi:hypothetical protein
MHMPKASKQRDAQCGMRVRVSTPQRARALRLAARTAIRL